MRAEKYKQSAPAVSKCVAHVFASVRIVWFGECAAVEARVSQLVEAGLPCACESDVGRLADVDFTAVDLAWRVPSAGASREQDGLRAVLRPRTATAPRSSRARCATPAHRLAVPCDRRGHHWQ